jgi:hypothetical protein
MTEPAYPFLVPFDGHPHPARLSPCGEFLLIRVWESERSGPVEVQQALGGPVGSVVRDLWAECGRLEEAVTAMAGELEMLDEYAPEVVAASIEALAQAALATTPAQSGAEWQRLKQVEARIATENPWRVPSNAPEMGSLVEVVEGWGLPALPARKLEGLYWRIIGPGNTLRSDEIAAWRYRCVAHQPQGWPGSAPAAKEWVSSEGKASDGEDYVLGPAGEDGR